MKKKILVPFSGTRNDVNRVIALANKYEDYRFDLLHVRNFNHHTARYFPTDVLDKLYFHCENIGECYSCSGAELAAFLKDHGDYSFPLAHCQYCQIGLNMITAHFIKKRGYEEIVNCSPLFDSNLCLLPALTVLEDFKSVSWSDPVMDWRSVSRKVKQRCLRNSCLGWDNDKTMPVNEIVDTCNRIMATGILERMTLLPIEFESEWKTDECQEKDVPIGSAK